VKSNVPALVGEPEMVPFAFSITPCGNVPADVVHVYGGVPPVAARVPVYAWPTVPAGSAFVEIVGAAGALIVIWSWRVADRLAASVTRTVNVGAPAVVGVPEIAPSSPSARPAGNAPADTAQV
jgi:hypothetical protein